MAIVTNTFTSHSAVGIRESLADIISSISPEEVPFQSNVGSENVSNTYFEWQTDSLASTSTTAIIDGDDVGSFDATSATTRVGNYTHIRRRTTIVADNLAAQDLAGRNDELSYQIAKRGKELKRDIEATLTDNNAQVAGNSSTARETGGLGAWIATNESVGTGGGLTTGDGTTARTDGTQRDFTEATVSRQSSWWDHTTRRSYQGLLVSRLSVTWRQATAQRQSSVRQTFTCLTSAP
jgi:hypothetical protein